MVTSPLMHELPSRGKFFNKNMHSKRSFSFNSFK